MTTYTRKNYPLNFIRFATGWDIDYIESLYKKWAEKNAPQEQPSETVNYYHCDWPTQITVPYCLRCLKPIVLNDSAAPNVCTCPPFYNVIQTEQPQHLDAKANEILYDTFLQSLKPKPTIANRKSKQPQNEGDFLNWLGKKYRILFEDNDEAVLNDLLENHRQQAAQSERERWKELYDSNRSTSKSTIRGLEKFAASLSKENKTLQKELDQLKQAEVIVPSLDKLKQFVYDEDLSSMTDEDLEAIHDFFTDHTQTRNTKKG